MTSPGEGVTVFTSPYLSAGAPALGEAKGLIYHLDKSIMKYKYHHFINLLLYVIKKHSGIKKYFWGVYFVQIFCREKIFEEGYNPRGFISLFTVFIYLSSN